MVYYDLPPIIWLPNYVLDCGSWHLDRFDFVHAGVHRFTWHAAPYDAIAPIITQRTKLSYRTARITQDVLFMVAAVMLLSHIGKRTYHTIYNALQTTETMRNNMSEYSTSDLMKNARKSPYFNAGMDRAKLT